MATAISMDCNERTEIERAVPTGLSKAKSKYFTAHQAASMISDTVRFPASRFPIHPKFENDSVYIFDTSAGDQNWWINDGVNYSDWVVRNIQGAPNHLPILQRRSSVLAVSETHQVTRNEYWEKDKKSEDYKTWKDCRVLVHYKLSARRDGQRKPPGVFKSRDNSKSKSCSAEEVQKDLNRRRKRSVSLDIEDPNLQNVTLACDVDVSDHQENSNDGSHSELSGVNSESHKRRCYSGVKEKPIPTSSKTFERLEAEIRKGHDGTTLYRDELRRCDKEDAPLQDIPTSAKQMHNLKQKIRLQGDLWDNDVCDTFAYAAIYPSYVKRMELFPGSLLVTTHPELIRHFNDIITTGKLRLVFHYDTTFNLGKRFVSILCVRHPGLEGNPVIPLCFLYHEHMDSRNTHSVFFKEVVKAFPAINNENNVIVTDREKAITKSIRKRLGRMKHAFCHNHIRQNVRRWLRKKKFSLKDAAKLSRDVKSLLWSESSASYDDKLHKYCSAESEDCVCEGMDNVGNIDEDFQDDEFYGSLRKEEASDDHEDNIWPPNFTVYYMTYLDKDIRQCCRFIVQDFPIWNDASGVLNNCSESANNALKNHVIKNSNATLYTLVSNVHLWQDGLLADIDRAYHFKKGNYRATTAFTAILQQPGGFPVVPNRMYRELTPAQRFKVDNCLSRRLDEEVNFHTKEGQARELVKNGKVTHHRDDIFIVTEMQGYSAMVVFPDNCTCPNNRCIHIIAVQQLLRLDSNARFDFLKFVNPSSLSTVAKNTTDSSTGKKCGSRAPPTVHTPKVRELEQINSEKHNDTADVDVESVRVEKVELPVATRKNASKVYLRRAEIFVRLKDLKTLQQVVPEAEHVVLGGKNDVFRPHWLTDPIIDFYISKRLDVTKHATVDSQQMRCLFTRIYRNDPTFQLSGLYGNTRGNWKKLELVFMPFWVSDHWCVLVASVQTTEIECYNSLNSKWVLPKKHHKHVTKILNDGCDNSDDVEWKFVNVNAVQQEDAINCGLMILHFVNQKIKGKPVDRKFNVSKFRARVLKTIAGECNLVTDRKIYKKTCVACGTEKVVRMLGEQRTEPTWIECEQCNGWTHLKCTSPKISEESAPLLPYVCT